MTRHIQLVSPAAGQSSVILEGVVMPGAASLFGSTALVGLPSMISFGYTSRGDGVAVPLLAANVAGSHTTVLGTATGTSSVEAES